MTMLPLVFSILSILCPWTDIGTKCVISAKFTVTILLPIGLFGTENPVSVRAISFFEVKAD